MQLSLEVVKDSKTVASASQRDSASMKALAAVTVLFLPGTAIASVFSMSMFEWDSTDSSRVLSNRFWIYWAITSPLAIFTISAYLIWNHRQAVLGRLKDREAVKGFIGFK